MGRLVWLGRSLLPVTYRAEGNAETDSELLLRQVERTADEFGAWRALCSPEFIGCLRVCIWVGGGCAWR
jgi:hypothetical protein